jgi:hypothetical protein
MSPPEMTRQLQAKDQPGTQQDGVWLRAPDLLTTVRIPPWTTSTLPGLVASLTDPERV